VTGIASGPLIRRYGLAFVRPEVEAAYRAWRSPHVLPYTRFALLSGVAGSSVAVVAVLLPPLAGLRPTALPLLLAIVVLHAGGLVLLRTGPHRLVTPFTAFANVASGVCAVLMTVPTDSFILTGAALTFISYAGLALIRLPPLLSVLVVLSSTLFAELVGVYRLHLGQLPADEVLIGSALLLAAFFTSLTVGLASERTTRHTYADSLVIEEQRAALFEEQSNLARFLAPEVADEIRHHGLDLKPAEVELTAIYVDLRGFSAYTVRHGPEAMSDLLEPYYLTVVECARRFSATVQSFTGDGALVVLGAPLAREDHAVMGHALAVVLRREVGRLLRRVDSTLGVGIGIASGPCAAGAIGALSRLEYTVVGNAVNLASRLCAQAADGQILMAPDTVSALPAGIWRTRSLRLKGFDLPVRVSVDALAA
jgi:class 3 adenylate cyclase